MVYDLTMLEAFYSAYKGLFSSKFEFEIQSE